MSLQDFILIAAAFFASFAFLEARDRTDWEAKAQHWFERAMRYEKEAEEESAIQARIFANVMKRVNVRPSRIAVEIDALNNPGNDSFAAYELLALTVGTEERDQ